MEKKKGSAHTLTKETKSNRAHKCSTQMNKIFFHLHSSGGKKNILIDLLYFWWCYWLYLFISLSAVVSGTLFVCNLDVNSVENSIALVFFINRMLFTVLYPAIFCVALLSMLCLQFVSKLQQPKQQNAGCNNWRQQKSFETAQLEMQWKKQPRGNTDSNDNNSSYSRSKRNWQTSKYKKNVKKYETMRHRNK